MNRSQASSPTWSLEVVYWWEGLLDAFMALGCWIENPPAFRQHYINVQLALMEPDASAPPVSDGSTGRIEYQTDSYAIAESIGVASRFSHLAAGAKAALTPETDDDVTAAVSVACAVLASRRGRGLTSAGVLDLFETSERASSKPPAAWAISQSKQRWTEFDSVNDRSAEVLAIHHLGLWEDQPRRARGR